MTSVVHKYCGICLNELDKKCLDCEWVDREDEKSKLVKPPCVQLRGVCKHNFHYHCIIQRKANCPRCPNSAYKWQLYNNGRCVACLSNIDIITQEVSYCPHWHFTHEYCSGSTRSCQLCGEPVHDLLQ